MTNKSVYVNNNLITIFSTYHHTIKSRKLEGLAFPRKAWE